jgi:hypothetical protein
MDTDRTSWTLYPPPQADGGGGSALELKWPTPLGWVTWAEFYRRGGHLQPMSVITSGTRFSFGADEPNS